MTKTTFSIDDSGWHITRLLRGITLGEQGPSVRIEGQEEPFFLRQSSLDCACGPNCLFMALMALGFFKREMLTGDGVPQSSTVRKMWQQAKKYHFVGTGLRS